MFVLSLQHAGSRADCYFTLRTSGRRSYGTKQLVVHVWLATFLGVGCSLEMWLGATGLRACEDEEASVGVGGWQPCSTGPLRPGCLCAAAVRVLSLRELREPGSRLAQGPVRPLEQKRLKIG